MSRSLGAHATFATFATFAFALVLAGCPREQKEAPAPRASSDPAPSASVAPAARWVLGKSGCSPTGWVRSDGLALATSCGASTVVWDLAAGKPLVTLAPAAADADDSIASFTFGRPSSHVAATVGGHSLRLWDLGTGAKLHEAELLVEHVEIAPDDGHVLYGNENGFVALVDPRSGKTVFSAQLHDGNVGTPCRYAFTSDGAIGVVVEPSRVVFVDAKSGKRREWAGGSGDVDTGAKVHPTRPLVVVGTSTGAVELVDAVTGKTDKTLRPAGKTKAPGVDGVQSVAFSADGSRVAAVVAGQLEIYETATAKKVRSEPLSSVDTHATASFGAALWLALQQEGADADLFDLSAAGPSKKLAGCTFAAFGESGLRVLCGNELFDVATGKRLDRPAMPKEFAFAAEPWQTASDDGGLRLRRARDGAMLTFAAAPGSSELVVFGEGGTYLGKRESAAKLLSKAGADGKPVAPSDAELSANERPKLLADFVAGR